MAAAALGVYARVLLHNGGAFLGLFQPAAAAGVAPPADAAPAPDPAARLLLALVDLWLDKFDSIGQVGEVMDCLLRRRQPRPDPTQRASPLTPLSSALPVALQSCQPGARKLSALALCVLLTAPLPALLERVELIVTHLTSVWFEVRNVTM